LESVAQQRIESRCEVRVSVRLIVLVIDNFWGTVIGRHASELQTVIYDGIAKEGAAERSREEGDRREKEQLASFHQRVHVHAQRRDKLHGLQRSQQTNQPRDSQEANNCIGIYRKIQHAAK
jgi:hypothetical protein